METTMVAVMREACRRREKAGSLARSQSRIRERSAIGSLCLSRGRLWTRAAFAGSSCIAADAIFARPARRKQASKSGGEEPSVVRLHLHPKFQPSMLCLVGSECYRAQDFSERKGHRSRCPA